MLECDEGRGETARMLELLHRLGVGCTFAYVDMLCPCIVAVDRRGVATRCVMRLDGDTVTFAWMDRYAAGGGMRNFRHPSRLVTRDPLARALYARLADVLSKGCKGGAAVARALEGFRP